VFSVGKIWPNSDQIAELDEASQRTLKVTKICFDKARISFSWSHLQTQYSVPFQRVHPAAPGPQIVNPDDLSKIVVFCDNEGVARLDFVMQNGQNYKYSDVVEATSLTKQQYVKADN
jgi:hypothetical protein